MLFYVVLYYVVLYYVMLCYVMLCYVMLCSPLEGLRGLLEIVPRLFDGLVVDHRAAVQEIHAVRRRSVPRRVPSPLGPCSSLLRHLGWGRSITGAGADDVSGGC